MRKDDKIRRSELFLPPPSINSRRPIPSDAELEEKQVSTFAGVVMVYALIGFAASSIIFGTGLWVVFEALQPTQVSGWDTSWFNCVVAASAFVFCRSWFKASSKL